MNKRTDLATTADLNDFFFTSNTGDTLPEFEEIKAVLGDAWFYYPSLDPRWDERGDWTSITIPGGVPAHFTATFGGSVDGNRVWFKI